MSREEFAESEYQYLVQEMRRMVKTKFDKLHERLDRVEKRDQQAQMSSNQKVDSRASRRYTSNDYSRRDYDRDSFSSRNSRRREADFDFESFREDVQDERYTSSRAPKKIATERSSRRIVRESYVCLISFVPFGRGKPSKKKYCPLDNRFDLRTSRFEDGGNDVSTRGTSLNANHESIKLPKGPMTRARTKKIQDALSALVLRIWDDNKVHDIGGAKDNALKTPCTLLQFDLSSSPAPHAPFSSHQLT
ncbi:hypothetical protein PVK06_035277 [Gossypium arboreum]|uniref:Uncharacterized protein n=1 Tax=Gossypium arboreum TaxID=29729 RepID=A0ABR0NGV5_GOSAR|nr:hypothetical protein PVK06_035277 [Gossypium arboreum]